MQVDCYRHAFPEETARADIACPEDPACMVIDRFDAAADSEPALRWWYAEVYFPKLNQVPGVISIRGFDLVRGSKKFKVLHYLRRDEVDMGQAWREARAEANEAWGIPAGECYRPLSPTFFSR